VSALPPEFLRKGRWDDMMFVDLPTESERETILKIHLEKRARDPKKFDVKSLAVASNGYSGAELEQAIVDAMFTAFADDGREVATVDVGNAIGRSVPLSRTMSDEISKLREWARTRCAPASKPVTTGAPKAGRKAAGMN